MSSATHNQPELPPLRWPEYADDKARLAWWRACTQAWLAQWENPAPLKPVSARETDALEQRLGCALPPSLRTWHEQIGALNLTEALCSVTPARYANIEPLRDAYPGLPTYWKKLLMPLSNGHWSTN